MKKLPSIYKNSCVKSNNKKMFCSQYEKVENKDRVLDNEIDNQYIKRVDKLDVLEAINRLFQKKKYAYTEEVLIKTKNRTFKTRLVFMKDNKVVTIDNETIDLDDIISI